MNHIMSEQEYEKYLADMQELEKLRRVKNNFARAARRHFDDIAFCLEHGTPLETMFSMISKCKKEDHDGIGKYYCDHCPFDELFGCPFGYDVEYSK